MDQQELLGFIKAKKKIGDLANTSRQRIRCPFCNSKDPDLQLYHDSNKFRCWNGSCEKRGSVIDWVMLEQNCSVSEAIKYLAASLGIDISTRDERSDVIQRASRTFQKALFKNQEVLDYWQSRGITEDTLYENNIGYCSMEVLQEIIHSGDSEKRISYKTLEDSELINKYGRAAFWNHTVFPYCHWKSGKAVQLQGRIVGTPKENESRWKCLATRSKLGYRNLNAMLWGEEKLSKYWKYAGKDGKTYSFLLEGIPDALTLRQFGVHAMSFVGNQNIKQHVWKISKLDKVYLVMDNEKSSQDHLPWELYDLLLETPNTQIINVTLPNLPGLNEKGNPIKQDVNDFFKNGGTLHDLKSIVDRSPTATEYLIDCWGKDEDKYQMLLGMIHERPELERNVLLERLSSIGLFSMDQLEAFTKLMKLDRSRGKSS